MQARTLPRLHAAAGVAGLALIASFWTSTILSEAFGDAADVLMVKTAILWALLALIPCLAAAGASGFRLAGPRAKGPVLAKKRRMPVIAAIGLLVLVPCAIFLQAKAAAGDFGDGFRIVQAIELIAGATNIALMSLNLRDGLRLARRRARPV